METKPTTSWGGVADWYDEHLNTEEDSYQRQVILPNILRLLELKKGMTVLDLACGSGFFARELAQACPAIGGVIGVDISAELINLAKKQKSNNLDYFISPAHDLSMIMDRSVDAVVNILAIQNIEEVKEMLSGVKRVLRPEGKLIVVMNHPAFRIPQGSGWQWNEAGKKQSRLISYYLSETRTAIKMHPGLSRRSGAKAEADTTTSFHRPLQYYFKLLNNEGFAVSRLEEWISHKTSQSGPRKRVEDKARKEFPLFLCLVARLG